MRVSTVMPRVQNTMYTANAEKSVKTSKVNLNNYNDIQNKSVLITFTGADKNMNQIHSVSVEDNIFGLNIYKAGGQGSIAEQITTALTLDGEDARGVVPYLSPGNQDSGIKVLCVPQDMDPAKLPSTMPEKYFKAYPLNTPIEQIAKEQNTTADRILYVAHDPADFVKRGKEVSKEKEAKFIVLKRMGIKREIERIDETALDKIKKIPYEIFKWESKRKAKRMENGVLVEKEIPVVRYVIHTADLAKAPKIYAYDMFSGDNPLTSLYFRDFCDASIDMLPELAEKDKYNPASVIGHCRTGFGVTESVIDRSVNSKFFRGYRVVDIFHNPTPNYQGEVYSPFDMLRYKARPEDWEKLRKIPQYRQLVDIDARFRAGHRPNDEEWNMIDKIVRPFLKNYRDDDFKYNLSIAPIIGKMKNPENIDANHVSHTFAKAVMEYNDLAKGLTNKFRQARDMGLTIGGRPNGCNIDSWGLDDPTKSFGNSANGLSMDLSWYHPYNPKTDSIDHIVKQKRANTEGFLNLLGDCYDERVNDISNFNTVGKKDKLTKLFFTDSQIDNGFHVLGAMTGFDPKDIVLTSWGRSDKQKGFPMIFEAYYQMLKDSKIPEEFKQHTKIILGSGPEPWKDDYGKGDFSKIKEIMYKIQTEFGGKYKGNVMYVNGFYPNRLTTAHTFTIFGSRYEPQGQTPLEGMLSGAVPGSTNEGAAGEAIITASENKAKANGFRTKYAFMKNVEDLGFGAIDLSTVSKEQKNAKRFELTAAELKDVIYDMNKVYREEPKLYEKMVENGVHALMDWHDNHAINGGRSTLQLYTEDGFELHKGWKGRNKNPLQRLVGEFGSMTETFKQETVNAVGHKVSEAQNRWVKAAAITGISLTAIGSALYVYYKKKTASLGSSVAEPPKTTDANPAAKSAPVEQQKEADTVKPADTSQTVQSVSTNPIDNAPQQETNLLNKIKTAK